jgi:hypothetical protein
MPRRASSSNIAADTRVALETYVMHLPYRRLTGRWFLVHIGIVKLLTIIIVSFFII